MSVLPDISALASISNLRRSVSFRRRKWKCSRHDVHQIKFGKCFCLSIYNWSNLYKNLVSASLSALIRPHFIHPHRFWCVHEFDNVMSIWLNSMRGDERKEEEQKKKQAANFFSSSFEGFNHDWRIELETRATGWVDGWTGVGWRRERWNGN